MILKMIKSSPSFKKSPLGGAFSAFLKAFNVHFFQWDVLFLIFGSCEFLYQFLYFHIFRVEWCKNCAMPRKEKISVIEENIDVLTDYQNWKHVSQCGTTINTFTVFWSNACKLQILTGERVSRQQHRNSKCSERICIR
jgi:hypothetical protein